MARQGVRIDWWALPLVLVAVPAALLLGMFGIGKNRRVSANDLVLDLERFVDFAEGRRDWDLDAFEAVPLADASLERLRRQAVAAGPPNVDLAALRRVLADARLIAAERAAKDGRVIGGAG